jgi:hypothetical protein
MEFIALSPLVGLIADLIHVKGEYQYRQDEQPSENIFFGIVF